MTIALLAGLATSIGPCAAPRYLALLALVEPGTGRVRRASVLRFALGTVCAYLVLGAGGASLLWVLHDQRVIQATLAACFVIGGLALSAARHCDHRSGTASGGFLPGFGSSLIASPCCTPAVLATAAAMEGNGVSVSSALVALAMFAIGHVTPVIVAGTTLRAGTRIVPAPVLRSVLPTAAGGCAVALGIYYGLAA